MPRLEKNRKKPLLRPPPPHPLPKLSAPKKKTNKTSLKFQASKSLIKTFYTLDKTPKGKNVIIYWLLKHPEYIFKIAP